MEGLCGPDTRFFMKQDILTLCKVLVSKGHSRSRPKRVREKCESIRGCIVDANLNALNSVIVGKTKREKESPGLAGATVPQKLGPTRVSRI